MGWIKKVQGHECVMPRVKFSRHDKGSIWACDCGIHWRIVRWWRTYAGDCADWEQCSAPKPDSAAITMRRQAKAEAWAEFTSHHQQALAKAWEEGFAAGDHAGNVSRDEALGYRVDVSSDELGCNPYDVENYREHDGWLEHEQGQHDSCKCPVCCEAVRVKKP